MHSCSGSRGAAVYPSGHQVEAWTHHGHRSTTRHTHTHSDRLFSQRKPTLTCKNIMKPSEKKNRTFKQLLLLFWASDRSDQESVDHTEKNHWHSFTFVDKGCWFKAALDHYVRRVDWWLERCDSIWDMFLCIVLMCCMLIFLVWVCGADFSFVYSSITLQLYLPDVSHSLSVRVSGHIFLTLSSLLLICFTRVLLNSRVHLSACSTFVGSSFTISESDFCWQLHKERWELLIARH